MDILSYPIGILIGLFPVLVDLGPAPAPAQLLLDGRPVCSVTARAPGCTIDLGAAPRIHKLELVRTDASGHITERVARWINRPGLQAEVHASGDCEEKGRTCTFRIAWAHPDKQDPKRLSVSLDGVIAHEGVNSSVRIRFPGRGWPPQVLSVDAVFPDGRRANTTHLLRAAYPEETEASLQAVPLRLDAGFPPSDLPGRLGSAGWAVKAVENGEAEVVFVIEPAAFAFLSAAGRHSSEPDFTRILRRPVPSLEALMIQPSMRMAAAIENVSEMRVVTANEALNSMEVLGMTGSRGDLSMWLRYLARAHSTAFSRVRTADAVVAAGYSLAASPRRRALVLVLGDRIADQGVFSPEEALAYLRQALVPLVVWRIGPAEAPGWPPGSVIVEARDFLREAALLRAVLDRQRVAWIDGRVDLREFHPSLPAGVHLGGREDME